MNRKDKDLLIKKVMSIMPKEHNRKLIEKTVLNTLRLLNKLPWYKRILKY